MKFRSFRRCRAAEPEFKIMTTNQNASRDPGFPSWPVTLR